jgi:hypothetical protein
MTRLVNAIRHPRRLQPLRPGLDGRGRGERLLAERLIAETVRKQAVPEGQPTVHADRGSSMRSKPVALLLADLGITKSHGRPHTSNDKPFSEAQPAKRGRPPQDPRGDSAAPSTGQLRGPSAGACGRPGGRREGDDLSSASKEALAQELLAELAGPHIALAETGNTREEMLAAVINPMRAVTETAFGPVIRALLSQIAVNPSLGDPFRATVVQARRDEVARVTARHTAGIARGDLRADADPTIATDHLVGPVYFRLMFGDELTVAFANRVVDSLLQYYSESKQSRRMSTVSKPKR